MKLIGFLLLNGAALLAQTAARDIVVIAPNEPVAGKPYSATQVTRSVQTLSNGAHIDQTITNLFYQDEQGRTRLETTDARGRVSIVDPVGMVTYVADLASRSVRKISMPVARAAAVRKGGTDISPLEEARSHQRPGDVIEDLGSRPMEGVMAVGVRVTATIPVGAIGNDQELKSVTERWYSNDIHALVKSVSTDPRTGTHTFELIRIVRGQQDPALFQPPAGFAVVSVPNGGDSIREQ